MCFKHQLTSRSYDYVTVWIREALVELTIMCKFELEKKKLPNTKITVLRLWWQQQHQWQQHKWWQVPLYHLHYRPKQQQCKQQVSVSSFCLNKTYLLCTAFLQCKLLISARRFQAKFNFSKQLNKRNKQNNNNKTLQCQTKTLPDWRTELISQINKKAFRILYPPL